MEFETCQKCGKPVEGMIDGRWVTLRCLCDWERGFHERLRRTVHPDFYRKTMGDWDPPLFASGGYEELMVLQKAAVSRAIYAFAFEKGEDGSEAIERNIARGRTLFIRGPEGSGRGLLAAMVKMATARLGIPTTTVGDYDIMKGELSNADIFGELGDAARVALRQKYELPGLMVLEQVRAESTYVDRNGNERIKQIKGSATLDSILAKRATRRGAMLVTSSDFIGEIAESMGDRMADTLGSPKTSLVIMLSPKESATLETALAERKTAVSSLSEVLHATPKESESGRSRVEKMSEAEMAAGFEDALYFEEAFPNVKVKDAKVKASIQKDARASIGKWARADLARPVWMRFRDAKENQTSEYESGVEKAREEMVRSCKELAKRLTRKEMLHIGKMLSVATEVVPGDDSRINKWRESNERYRGMMSD